MRHVFVSSNDDLLAARQVRQRYGVSDMTIHRWLANRDLDFPQPIRILGRRYWRVSALQAFEAQQATGNGTAKPIQPNPSGE